MESDQKRDCVDYFQALDRLDKALGRLRDIRSRPDLWPLLQPLLPLVPRDGIEALADKLDVLTSATHGTGHASEQRGQAIAREQLEKEERARKAKEAAAARW